MKTIELQGVFQGIQIIQYKDNEFQIYIPSYFKDYNQLNHWLIQNKYGLGDLYAVGAYGSYYTLSKL